MATSYEMCALMTKAVWSRRRRCFPPAPRERNPTAPRFSRGFPGESGGNPGIQGGGGDPNLFSLGARAGHLARTHARGPTTGGGDAVCVKRTARAACCDATESRASCCLPTQPAQPTFLTPEPRKGAPRAAAARGALRATQRRATRRHAPARAARSGGDYSADYAAGGGGGGGGGGTRSANRRREWPPPCIAPHPISAKSPS